MRLVIADDAPHQGHPILYCKQSNPLNTSMRGNASLISWSTQMLNNYLYLYKFLHYNTFNELILQFIFKNYVLNIIFLNYLHWDWCFIVVKGSTIITVRIFSNHCFNLFTTSQSIKFFFCFNVIQYFITSYFITYFIKL